MKFDLERITVGLIILLCSAAFTSTAQHTVHVGSLGYQSQACTSNEDYFDVFSFEVHGKHESIDIDLHTPDFSPYMVAVSPSGNFFRHILSTKENDHSFIRMTAGESGIWHLAVGASNGGADGVYTLTMVSQHNIELDDSMTDIGSICARNLVPDLACSEDSQHEFIAPGFSTGCITTPKDKQGRPSKIASVCIGSLSPHQPYLWSIESKKIPISRLIIEVNKHVSDVHIDLEMLDPNGDHPKLGGNVYKYFSLESDALTKDVIDKVTIEYSVENTWLDQNGLDAFDTHTWHYTDSWESMPTELIGITNNGQLYQAETHSFSPFGINGDESASEAVNALAQQESNTIGVEIPTDGQDTETAPVGNEVDRITEEFDNGYMVYNVPDSIKINKTENVELKLCHLVNVNRLQESIESLKSTFDTDDELRGRSVEISEIMEAKLVAADDEAVKVKELTSIRQAVGTADTTSWLWSVKPLKEGEHELILTLNAVIKVDGESETKVLETFRDQFHVTVPVEPEEPWYTKLWKVIGVFLAEEWKWLWAVLVVPAAGWLWNKWKKGSSGGAA